MNEVRPGDVLNILKIIILWCLLFGIPLMLASLVYKSQLRLPESILTINELEYINSDVDNPVTLPEMPGSIISLPHDWRETNPHIKHAWYSLKLNLNVPPNRLWGIYLPCINMNTAVYLNQQLLGDGGSFSEPIARNWNYPQYFAIPNGLLRTGENIFHIRIVSAGHGYGYLGQIHLAPNEVLRPAYDFRYLMRVSVAQVITASLIIMSFFMGVLAWLRRKDSIYAWFTAVLLIWAVHNLNLFVVNIPFSTRVWEWLWYITMVWFVIVVTVFVHRFTDTYRPALEKKIYLVGTLGSIVLLLLPEYWFYQIGFKVWDSFAVLLGIYPTMLVLKTYRKRHDVNTYLLLLSGLLVLIFGIHDWLMLNGFSSLEDGLLLHFAAPLPLLVFSWMLLTRFVQVLNETETLNVELEQRVEDKHLELENNYKKLQTLESERVLVQERERIMRDMHDGMGGHLVSTISMLDAGKATSEDLHLSLTAALDDLRLMIDSLDPVEEDLTAVLAMYRARIQPRLEQSNLQIKWQVTDLPRMPGLGPEKSLHILRIMQEAISNTIKYANASVITIRTLEEPGTGGKQYVKLEIQDNGNGISEMPGHGRGLNNMHKRAKTINAVLNIDSNNSGTTVSLCLPLG